MIREVSAKLTEGVTDRFDKLRQRRFYASAESVSKGECRI